MGLVGVLHPLCFRKAVIGGPAWVPESSRKEMRLLLVLLGVLLGAPGAPALSFEASEETELVEFVFKTKGQKVNTVENAGIPCGKTATSILVPTGICGKCKVHAK